MSTVFSGFQQVIGCFCDNEIRISYKIVVQIPGFELTFCMLWYIIYTWKEKTFYRMALPLCSTT